MRPLTYVRAGTVDEAVALVAADPASAFLAGGTTEIDLIRAGVSASERVVDINDLPLGGVEPTADGGLRIGALARMSDVARTPVVAERYPAISQALLLGASEHLFSEIGALPNPDEAQVQKRVGAFVVDALGEERVTELRAEGAAQTLDKVLDRVASRA